MERNPDIAFESLENNINNLISKYEQAVQERNLLKEEIERLEKKMLYYETELKKSNLKNRDLEEEINKLNLLNAFTASAEDKKNAKAAIAGIIKKIDKCIALINNER